MEPSLCWLPQCSKNVIFVVRAGTYPSGILGFCADHRPYLRVLVDSDMREEVMPNG